MKPFGGIAVYVLIKGGLILAFVIAFLAWPEKPALLRADGRRGDVVSLGVTLHGPEGDWSQDIQAGKRTHWLPIGRRKWDSVTVSCDGGPPQRFDVGGGPSTLLTVTTLSCGYVEVRASRYP